MSILDGKELEQWVPPYGSNPFEKDGAWYWYDESGDLSKPQPTRERAQAMLDAYIKYLNGEEDNA